MNDYLPDYDVPHDYLSSEEILDWYGELRRENTTRATEETSR